MKDFFSKCDQIRKILNGKLHFLCGDCFGIIVLFLQSLLNQLTKVVLLNNFSEQFLETHRKTPLQFLL